MTFSRTIAVLGGGAAGMMAAIAAGESAVTERAGARSLMVRIGHEDTGASEDFSKTRVVLFEKNKYLGAKVLISGGGRCNVTTGIFDVRKLLENYPRGAKFLMSAMFRFPPEKVMEWFESHGVRLKVEEDLRVFPVSNNGKDVVGAMERELARLGVEVILGANVTEAVRSSGAHGTGAGGRGKFVIRLKDGRDFEADAVIITTGGNAYSHTGSTGDGYAFARNLGHTITELSPSLNSFVLGETWRKKLAGVSFEKVGMTLKSADGAREGAHERVDERTVAGARAGGRKQASARQFKRTGPVVFTHQGLSGPAIFALSSLAARETYDAAKPMELSVNFFPDESREELSKRFQKMADEHGKKTLVNFLDMFLPKSLCEVILGVLKADPGMQTGRLPKTVREALIGQMTRFTMRVVGRGAGEEFVTAGGVALDEVNPNTMESKKCPGLYFAGEILDVDAFTGGFNLQGSWATGRLAGESALTR